MARRPTYVVVLKTNRSRYNVGEEKFPPVARKIEEKTTILISTQELVRVEVKEEITTPTTT